MSELDLVRWEQIKNDVALRPLPLGAAELIDRLLYQREIPGPLGGFDLETVSRLCDFGLARMLAPIWDDDYPTYEPKQMLYELRDRGWLAQLVAR